MISGLWWKFTGKQTSPVWASQLSRSAGKIDLHLTWFHQASKLANYQMLCEIYYQTQSYWFHWKMNQMFHVCFQLCKLAARDREKERKNALLGHLILIDRLRAESWIFSPEINHLQVRLQKVAILSWAKVVGKKNRQNATTADIYVTYII